MGLQPYSADDRAKVLLFGLMHIFVRQLFAWSDAVALSAAQAGSRICAEFWEKLLPHLRTRSYPLDLTSTARLSKPVASSPAESSDCFNEMYSILLARACECVHSMSSH